MQNKSDNSSNNQYGNESDNQSDQRELQMQFEYLTSQIEEAKRQLGELKLVLEEAQETLLALAELQLEQKSSMTSLGSNIFVKSTIHANTVIAPIGGNVYCQKPIVEARQIVETRATKISQLASNIEKALMQMMQARQQLIQQAQQ